MEYIWVIALVFAVAVICWEFYIGYFLIANIIKIILKTNKASTTQNANEKKVRVIFTPSVLKKFNPAGEYIQPISLETAHNIAAKIKNQIGKGMRFIGKIISRKSTID
jgi:hypothetical protein